MSVRARFEAELEELKQRIIEMANMSKQAVDKAIKSLKEQDLESAKQIAEEDQLINKKESEIHESAITLIARQQPVATDLRRIMVATKVASEIERIGDLAVNISKSTIEIGENPFIKPIEHIPQMAEKTQSMLSRIIDAFTTEDNDAAFSIAKEDDEVDKMYNDITEELMNLITEKPGASEQITQLAFICRNLERAGDHVTNIAENIIYIKRGERLDLNL